MSPRVCKLVCMLDILLAIVLHAGERLHYHRYIIRRYGQLWKCQLGGANKHTHHQARTSNHIQRDSGIFQR